MEVFDVVRKESWRPTSTHTTHDLLLTKIVSDWDTNIYDFCVISLVQETLSRQNPNFHADRTHSYQVKNITTMEQQKRM